MAGAWLKMSFPKDKVDTIRESVEKTVEAHGTYTGVKGVGTRKGLLAFNQSFAPYLADKRVLGIAEALFGPHVRISFTTAHINYPGNVRGALHADWPFNQHNAGHIPCPLSRCGHTPDHIVDALPIYA